MGEVKYYYMDFIVSLIDAVTIAKLSKFLVYSMGQWK